MPKALSPRQEEILELLYRQAARNGRPPTQVEIAEHFGFSQQAARQHLGALAQKGAIELLSGSARGIRLPDRGNSQPGGIPLIGRIAAGAPITSSEHVERFVDIVPASFRPRAHYLFRVQGQSMNRLGILDGDLVAIHEEPIPAVGSVVAAVVVDPQTSELTLTLKRYRSAGGRITLVSENDDQRAFPPQTYGADSGIRIVGRYVGLLRGV